MTVILGFLGGLMGGLLGVGGGILFVPALTVFQDQSQVHAEATSLLAIIPVAIIATQRQLGYGNVRLKEGLTLGLLSPIGVLLGVVIANNVSQRALELSFAALALFVAYKMGRKALTAPAPERP